MGLEQPLLAGSRRAVGGGVHSTVEDLARLMDDFLSPSGRVLKPHTAAAMTTSQTALDEPWGFGWAVKPGMFGARCSAGTFGHFGVTGTFTPVEVHKRCG